MLEFERASNMNEYIEFSEEVGDALKNEKPIIAIETGGLAWIEEVKKMPIKHYVTCIPRY